MSFCCGAGTISVISAVNGPCRKARTQARERQLKTLSKPMPHGRNGTNATATANKILLAMGDGALPPTARQDSHPSSSAAYGNDSTQHENPSDGAGGQAESAV